MMEMIKNWIAVLMSKYLMPDYEAHQRAAKLQTSANEIYLRRELDKMTRRAHCAEKHVRMFCDIGDRLVLKAVQLSQEETTPFVHETILEIENGRRYVT